MKRDTLIINIILWFIVFYNLYFIILKKNTKEENYIFLLILLVVFIFYFSFLTCKKEVINFTHHFLYIFIVIPLLIDSVKLKLLALIVMISAVVSWRFNNNICPINSYIKKKYLVNKNYGVFLTYSTYLLMAIYVYQIIKHI